MPSRLFQSPRNYIDSVLDWHVTLANRSDQFQNASVVTVTLTENHLKYAMHHSVMHPAKSQQRVLLCVAWHQFNILILCSLV